MKCPCCQLDLPEPHKSNQLVMDHYFKDGVKYRTIKGCSWGELEELEQVYNRRGYRTYLDFGNICDDLFKLVIEMQRAA